MNARESSDYKIVNTTEKDWENVIELFEKVLALQGKNGYRVWNEIDRAGLHRDLNNNLQYKICWNNEIVCLFSIQYGDPLIWRERDQHDAVYLHRVVVDPVVKGQKLFARVLDWSKQHALQKNLSFIRVDTWADNTKLIAYYRSFGFAFIENYKTPDVPELPVQNRNLEVALLEMRLK